MNTVYYLFRKKTWQEKFSIAWKWFKDRANSPWAALWLALFAFIDSWLFLPFPPEVLFVAMLVAVPNRRIYHTTVIILASLAGGYISYAIGTQLVDPNNSVFLQTLGLENIYAEVKRSLQGEFFWPLTFAVLFPAPSVPFMIAAGATGVGLVPFTLAVIIGRTLRFVPIAIIVHYFGAYMIERLSKHSNKATVIFTILLIIYLLYEIL